MTHHEEDPGFRGLTTKPAHQIADPIGAPIPSIHKETTTVNAAHQNEDKDEETLKTPGVKLFHAPTVVEDESFYVSLFRGL